MLLAKSTQLEPTSVDAICDFSIIGAHHCAHASRLICNGVCRTRFWHRKYTDTYARSPYAIRHAETIAVVLLLLYLHPHSAERNSQRIALKQILSNSVISINISPVPSSSSFHSQVGTQVPHDEKHIFDVKHNPLLGWIELKFEIRTGFVYCLFQCCVSGTCCSAHKMFV